MAAKMAAHSTSQEAQKENKEAAFMVVTGPR
jgi:hypothetical protein